MHVRWNDRARMTTLAAAFVMLVAGIVVAGPGVGAVSVGSTTSNEHDDQGNHYGHCKADEYGNGLAHADVNGVDSVAKHYTNLHRGLRQLEECEAKLTVFKTPVNDHGGNLGPGDFQLLVDGHMIYQGVPEVVTPGVEHVVSEVSQPGYVLRSIVCTDDTTGEQVFADGAVTLAEGDRVTCEVTNDDIAPTVVVHKNVVNDNGGTAEPASFQMTLNGDPIDQETSYNLVANEPNVVSEDGSVTGYEPTSAVCTSDIAGSLNNKTVTGTGAIEVTPAPAEHIDCTITNDDVAAGLTVIKRLIPDDGGDEQIADFPLQVNGVPVQSGELIGFQYDFPLAITETQLPGWIGHQHPLRQQLSRFVQQRRHQQSRRH